ncbi:MAG: serine hydrolase [Opitutaceae bacterium]|nr:serine hydrolase [Opitutaceae bacterium]MBL4893323.1 serine hydrolase [Emcibacter sp.]
MKHHIKNTIIAASLLALPTQALLPQYLGTKAYANERSITTKRPGLSTAEIDQLVAKVMDAFQVPGMAVGIIKDGKVIHAKGYGIREVGKKGKVDEKTLFSIASTGKSFTAGALALLVDDGKIKWDDKVIDYISAFQMNDPWVTREFTIKDLLIHNSGLGLGAGDLMFWPTSGFSREEIIRNLKHLKPVSSFRTKYAYDNLLYIVAGEVIAVVSGESYEDFVDRRILKPLGMKHCAANRSRLKKVGNIAEPHQVMGGKLTKVSRLEAVHERSITAAAGGIQCSVQSILKWHQMHLNKGKFPNGDILFSEMQHAEIMTPQTITPVTETKKDWFGTSFSAYGLGWFLEDIYGVKLVQHSGGLQGMTSLNAMIPELGLGVAIYTNQQAGYDRPAIMYSILDSYLTDGKRDWIPKLLEVKKKRIADAAKMGRDLTIEPYTPTGSIERYIGTYKDPWFGTVDITKTKGGLYFSSARSARLKGRMVPFKSDLFIVQWDDRTLDADAYVKFTTGYDGNPEGIIMKAVSPLTDFSFDFHDLNFERVSEKKNSE